MTTPHQLPTYYHNYDKYQYSSSSTSAADLLLITLVYDSSSPSTYFTYSPPYFLLPPATYPLQQLLVPVHRPYSFTLPPTPSSCLLQLPSSFYQFPFFDNYQLPRLQLLSAPAQTFSDPSSVTIEDSET